MDKRNIILDLCGGTGAWSNPYRDRYCVINITLPDYDILDVQFIKDTIIDIPDEYVKSLISGDYDNDGDADIFINESNTMVRSINKHNNKPNSGHYVQFNLNKNDFKS